MQAKIKERKEIETEATGVCETPETGRLPGEDTDLLSLLEKEFEALFGAIDNTTP